MGAGARTCILHPAAAGAVLHIDPFAVQTTDGAAILGGSNDAFIGAGAIVGVIHPGATAAVLLIEAFVI